MAKLFTIKIFEADNSKSENGRDSIVDMDEFPNMINAGIIKGRMVELEHSLLVGPSVKFKTVINYDRHLEPGKTLGLSTVVQDGYITKQNPT